MARYLRSQTTGVVLPYNEKLLKRANVELMTPEECSQYEAGLKPRPVSTVVETVTTVVETITTPEPTPEPVVEELTEDEVVAKQPVVEPAIEVSDISEGEPTAAELLDALGLDDG